MKRASFLLEPDCPNQVCSPFEYCHMGQECMEKLNLGAVCLNGFQCQSGLCDEEENLCVSDERTNDAKKVSFRGGQFGLIKESDDRRLTVARYSHPADK